jgi:hypothetical protein
MRWYAEGIFNDKIFPGFIADPLWTLESFDEHLSGPREKV